MYATGVITCFVYRFVCCTIVSNNSHAKKCLKTSIGFSVTVNVGPDVPLNGLSTQHIVSGWLDGDASVDAGAFVGTGVLVCSCIWDGFFCEIGVEDSRLLLTQANCVSPVTNRDVDGDVKIESVGTEQIDYIFINLIKVIVSVVTSVY